MLKLECPILLFTMLLPYFSWSMDDAKADKYVEEQRAACAKNTAMEWSATLNRCVGKADARQTRSDTQSCEKITDMAAREKCHLSIAEKKSGLSSDPNSLNKDGTSKSMLLNGAAAAYSAVSLISENGMELKGSSCTSKNILGITSVAGLASDLFLKNKAKKKIKELEGKYKLEKTLSGYQAQVKAFEYLKEEQQTVAEIASLEKKRNMLLMAGYALAAGFAAYEIFWGKNPACSGNTTEEGQGTKPTETANVEVAASPESVSAGTGSSTYELSSPSSLGVKATPGTGTNLTLPGASDGLKINGTTPLGSMGGK